MHKSTRRFDAVSSARIDQLERRHSALKEQITLLDQRRYLTGEEESLVHELKKERLAAKDEITTLRRGLHSH
ncbi:MAG TPA: YdcH family protein [Polyangiaceae bacterium]|jgi:uncharacterized protein YdcH (DUF465 family)|nr:YdcH family protein [Polyangiaceae bacterium]